MKVYDIPKSGKRGRIVAFKSRYGQCEREHTSSTKPRTAAQRRSQAKFGTASAGWNYLTDDQRKAWRAYAKTVPSHPQGGQSGHLTGQALYTAINRNQAALGLPPFDYPPDRPVFGPNPVAGFNITQARGRVALRLAMRKAPAAHILIFASAPYNEGREYCDKFRYIGPLSPPTAGECDIAAQYVEKYGPPWPGSRVILRIVQQVNGWRNLPERIEAVFPRTQAPPSPLKRRKSAGKGP
jgi:hypothetical protein